MNRKWWKESIIYQIYPRSFMDSNADGIGDLTGIRQKLDYLADLGITCIWISPIFKSPQDDNGYDISDYRDIAPEFGTLDDFKLLLKEAHDKGIKILMDLVVNHTSDEHPWFIESRKSKDNPYRDYYIWRDGKADGGPPSDWGSHFSGSAWEYDENTKQYYLHLFSKKQPDLNWENPKVRQEVYDMMRFWCDMGIDGFRIDTVIMYSKNLDFPDTGTLHKLASEHFNDGPRMHEFLREMNQEVLSRYDVMTVGEASGLTPETASLYVADERGELNMIFYFEHVMLGREKKYWGKPEPAKPIELKKIFSKWQNELNGWNSQYFSNHDQPRQVSKFGNDKELRKESAKMLATLIHTLRGTPYVYQGEELGMTNCPFELDEHRDVQSLNLLKYCRENSTPIETVLDGLAASTRDNSRTPMQWNGDKNAGFSSGKPWIKVNPNYKEINAENEQKDPDSIFNYYKTLISLRKQNLVFVYGDFKEYDEENEECYVFTRSYEGKTLFVFINFTDSGFEYKLPPELDTENFEHLLGNYGKVSLKEFHTVRPYEAHIWIR